MAFFDKEKAGLSEKVLAQVTGGATLGETLGEKLNLGELSQADLLELQALLQSGTCDEQTWLRILQIVQDNGGSCPTKSEVLRAIGDALKSTTQNIR